MREGSELAREERFRQNEVLRAFAEGAPGPFALQCECADADCREFVLVAEADVYAVRANPRRFVLATDHAADGDRIVLTYAGYVIVEVAEEA